MNQIILAFGHNKTTCPPRETVARRERAVQKATRFPTQRTVASIFFPAHDVAGGRGKRNTCATSPWLNGFGSSRMGRMCFLAGCGHFMRNNFCGCSTQSVRWLLGQPLRDHDFFSLFPPLGTRYSTIYQQIWHQCDSK